MRFLGILAFLFLSFAACADGKPTDEECRKALKRILKLTDAAEGARSRSFEASVRNCRALSTKKAVRCVMAANTVEELKQCNADLGAAESAE